MKKVRAIAIVIAMAVAAALAACAQVSGPGVDTQIVDTATDTAGDVDAASDLPDTTVPPDTEDASDPEGEACPPGLTDCDGECLDLSDDPENCATCGHECPDSWEHTTPVCVAGACGWECDPGWVNNDGLPGCEDACPGSGVEACNGIDDDCDDVTDDGFTCAMGSAVECTTECMTFGTGVCNFSCGLPGPAACTPPVEACNGIDDDCDDIVDEGFPAGTCATCTPDCTGRECGPDPSCGTACGSCTPPETCSGAGACGCAPDCGGRECGPDPTCGTSCGSCTLPETCNAWGACACVPDCTFRECGTEAVCGTSCGSCTPPETCDASGRCVETCTPNCTGRLCGPDPACAQSCGTCSTPLVCDASGACVASCTPSCSGRECGMDPVCGTLLCGTCTLPETCGGTGMCVCTPDCTGRECGLDPVCGVLPCGSCAPTDTCDASGQCVAPCTPACGGRECGMDPVCGTLPCGTCSPPEACNGSGQCVCTPDCAGRECGWDPVCGTMDCGSCTAPEWCNASGTCVCVSDCAGRECGLDPVCGTLSCGGCTPPETCNSSGICEFTGCPPPIASCTTGTESRDRCTGARTIGRPAAAGSGGYAVSDSTCYAYNRFDDSCWDAGADHAYRIYLLAGETMSVYTYAGLSCSGYSEMWWDLTLKIIQNSGCSDTACTTRVVCEEYISSHTESFTAPHDGWYFIVVDGTTAFDDEGDYDLVVRLTCAAGGCGC